MILSTNIACTHCRLEFDSEVMIKENNNHFCCAGCQGVYNLLSSEGLDDFYEKTGKVTLSPPTNKMETSSSFDTDSFHKKFVKENRDGSSEVSLIIEGIHCSACVWLNEKVLHKMDGVIEANINFTNNKANIIWIDDIVKLSNIIEVIRSIGYNAHPYDASLQEQHANKERKEYYLRMAVAIFASMNIMWIAVAQYAGYFSGITQEIKTTLNIAEGVLATPVLFYSGWIFFKGAYFGIKNRVTNMDLLVASGASITYVYSIYITILEHGEAYFDSVSMIVTFVLIGKFLEVISKKKIADTLDIMTSDLPNEVNVLQEKKIISCNINDIKVKDIVVVSSGERILLDAKIISGKGTFDESNLTGENEPVYKKIGDNVVSGTVSIDADIHCEVSKDFAHSTFSNLVALLENAINKKPKIEQLANRLSEHFSTAILGLAMLTFFVWWFWPHNFEESLMVSISVIVIACPCALGLATPIATLVGISLGTRRGVLFKEASQLETMAKVDTLVVDKTGTLTIGKPAVIKETLFEYFDIKLLYSLVKLSKHPVSKGILKHIKDDKYNIDEVILENYTQVPARGMKAQYKGLELIGGNLNYMIENSIDINYKSQNTIFYFAIDNKVVAIYELKDIVKPGAKELVKELRKKGIRTIMLTGDHKSSALDIAQEIGIDNVNYNFTPEDKLNYIDKLHEENRIVVMVGDGVNDILALAKADIGIAMGSGSDIALEVGDVVLLNNSLESLLDTFKISSTTFKLIKQNFAISLIYNAVTIPLAMAGFIIPLIAAISMSLSSLLVVGNSLRIKYKYKRG